MAVFRNAKTWADRIGVDNAPATDDEVVRLGDLETLLAANYAPISHDHAVGDLLDFHNQVLFAHQSEGGSHEDSDTVEWNDGAGYSRRGNVRLKSSGGLLADENGLYLDFGDGENQSARGNHTHDFPATVLNPQDGSLLIALSEGEWFLSVNAEPGTSGLMVDEEGLKVDFGTGPTQVATGDHTHEEFHDPVTGGNTSTVTMTVATGQIVSAAVKLSTSSSGKVALQIDGAGLYLPVGPSGTQAAAGNHTHALATESTDGFLSAADKTKLNAFTALANIDQSAGFFRPGAIEEDDLLPQRYAWSDHAMRLLNAHLTAIAPTAECVVTLEINGSGVATISVPTGSPGAEVTNIVTFEDEIILPAEAFLRARLTTGVGTEANEPHDLALNVTLRPT